VVFNGGLRPRWYIAAVLLYGTLILCALTVGVIVYRYDLYDREPVLLLALATALGMGAMELAGQLEVYWLVRAGEEGAHNRWLVSGLAASHEELAKALVVLLIAVCFRRAFNDPMDGLIYGSFAGLGAAIDESIYVIRDVGPGEGLPPSEVVRVLGHLVMGGIGGSGLGLMRLRWWWALSALASLALAMGLHFGWDVVAVPANDELRMTPAQRAVASSIMLGGMGIYWGMVHVGSRLSRAMFGGRHDVMWGWPFVRARSRRG
jgi:RsiW-degrading membrane proteinase PrsW (M82 family)